MKTTFLAIAAILTIGAVGPAFAASVPLGRNEASNNSEAMQTVNKPNFINRSNIHIVRTTASIPNGYIAATVISGK